MLDRSLRCADIRPVYANEIHCDTQGGHLPISLAELKSFDHPLFNGGLDDILSKSVHPVLELQNGGDHVVVTHYDPDTQIPEPHPKECEGNQLSLTVPATPTDDIRRITLATLESLVDNHRSEKDQKREIQIWPHCTGLTVCW